MSDEVQVSLSRLRKRRTLYRARIAAFLQSFTIFLLLFEMSEEYSHNQYMQAWMSQHIGALSFMLNGTLAAFYAGLMIAYYLGEPWGRTAEPRLKKKEEIILDTQAS